MSALPETPQSIGRVLDSGFRLFKASFGGTVLLALACAILLTLPGVYLLSAGVYQAGPGGPQIPDDFLVAFGIIYVVAIAIYNVFYAAILHYCDAVARDAAPSVSASLKRGLVKSPALIIAFILYGIAVLLGLVLLVVPGLILMVSLLFFSPRIVLEDEGFFASLKGSHRMVWGNWWRTTALFTVLMVIYMVIYLAIGVPTALVDSFISPALIGSGPMSLVGQGVATLIVLPYLAASFLAMYYDLRLRSEGQDLAGRIDELAAGR